MRSTGVLLRVSAAVTIALGVVTAGVVPDAVRTGGDLAAPLALAAPLIGAAWALAWMVIRRLQAILHVAQRLSHVLIATIGVALATDLGLPAKEIERIRVAALLHDIGKIAVPEQILEKPSALSTSEWDFVKQHPRIGQVILDESGGLAEAGKIILHHHERFGGHGYPHGLRGRDIPIGSRIVSIADAYDAMIQDRPYKGAVGHDDALFELRRHAGTQFDPELVDIFVRLFASRAPIADLGLLGRQAIASASRRGTQRRASA